MAVIHGTNIEVNKVPSLDLRFADRKSLVDTISGENLIDFSRSSSATYVDADGVIQTAASNIPRFDHDPVTGESLGLLVEEARTNYTPDGTGFTVISGNGRTAPENGTFSSTSVANPTGSAGSTLFTTAAVSGTYIQIAGGDSSQGNVGNAMSMFIKPNGITKIFLSTYTTAGNQGAYFDLTGTGSVVGVVNNLPTSNYFITAHPNSWYRIGVRSFAGAPVNYRCAIWEYDGSSNPQWTSVTGDGTSGFYIWGWQNELGKSDFWTSVIPTSGSTVTRSADVASMTGSNFTNFFNNQEGTLSFQYQLTPSNFSIGNRMLVAFADSIDTYVDVIGMWGSGSVRYIDTVGNNNSSGTRWADSSLVYTPPSMNKYAIGYKVGTGTSNFAFNGVLQGARNTVATSVNGLFMGGGPKNYISRLTYYPQRLQDSTLQKLTE